MFAGMKLLPGVRFASVSAALLAGSLLGVVYVVLRPILRLLSKPIGCLTLGLANAALDVVILYGCSRVVEGFTLENIWWAVALAIFVNIICAIVGGGR